MPLPIHLTDEQLRTIELLAGYGLSLEKIAKVLRVPYGTLESWMAEEGEARRVWETGRAMAEAQVGQSLLQQALNGNIAAITWYEKTRCGRRERVEVVTADLRDVTEAMRGMTEQQLRALAQGGASAQKVLKQLEGG